MMEHYVEIIPQETSNTCWAASMAMLLQYLSGNTSTPASQPVSVFATGFTPEYVARSVGGVVQWAYSQNRMLSTDFRDNFTQLAERWGLVVEFTFNNQPASEWERLLRTFGPLYILVNEIYNDHAVVVTGINQEELMIADPWPVGQGNRYTIPRADLRPTGTMIHAGPRTVVLQPGRGGGS